MNHFHTHQDNLISLGYNHGWLRSNTHKTLEIETRQLSYKFTSHFHPYITELVDRLIQQSVSGLQSLDTEYRTIIQLSDSDRTIISLKDGTIIKRLDNSFIKFSGNKILQLDSANLEDSVQIVLEKNASVIIPQNTSAFKLSSNQPITIPNDILARVIYGKPTPLLYEEIFSTIQYDPNPELVPNTKDSPHPVKDLDFTSGGAYSCYNWELFFHIPITIAIHLSKNQRFEESMQWFHYIFDPTDNSDGPTPERFWKVKPFQYTDVKLVEDILINLSSNADSVLKEETIKSINAWKQAPFRPHVIARYRQSAYMFKTVMAYLDNLIDWGDSLFRQDTRESINEAAQLYILAANILGPKMQAIPQKSSVRPQSYAQLRDNLDEFGNVLRDAEIKIPFGTISLPSPAADVPQANNLSSLGRDLYFCVPHNDKLLSYWDTVSDRLFKIRNSLNLQGIFRQLPLFEPPIDPALLAKAAASGLDVGAIVNGLNQPLPLVRLLVLVQKAAEICQEVKLLGNNLLSAMEKEDNEALAILRSQHERTILGLVETVKYSQWQEAIKAREGLETSLENAFHRYTYYERQLGKKDNEITLPKLDSLGVESLNEMKFKSNEPVVGLREISIDIAQDLTESGGKIISSYEKNEIESSRSARDWQVRASRTSTLASVSHFYPTFGAHAQPLGPGGSVSYGGSNIGSALQALAEYQRNFATQDSYDASHAAKIGGFQKREQEWAFQGNLVAGEITQIFKQ